MTHALITGITGQDAPLLARLLLDRGYAVTGMARDQETPACAQLLEELPGLQLVVGDLADGDSLRRAVAATSPDEVYNLAGFSSVGRSWENAELAAEVNGLGVLRLLEALRWHCGSSMAGVRFYQASSSEMFGQPREWPQNELTPFHPRSPYGVAKAFAHYMTINFRESYGAFTSCGILYNHESPRRGPDFVTRKITRAAARIRLGRQDSLVLGDIDIRRDWGHAGDYVEAMWLMLQAPEPGDYVVASGQTHSLRDVLQVAFRRAGIEDWQPYVTHDPSLLRPAEVTELVGDATKAATLLGWRPTRTFTETIEEMVDADLAAEG